MRNAKERSNQRADLDLFHSISIKFLMWRADRKEGGQHVF
jgi:hypothetical protein